jgi:hypothetical protein
MADAYVQAPTPEPELFKAVDGWLLNELLVVVRGHQAVLLRAWHDFFGTGHGTGAGGKGSGH